MHEGEQIVCDVETTMKYVVRGEKATFHAGDRAKSYWPVDEHPVTIHDVRPIRDQLSFERNGFVVVDEPTDVTDFSGSELERYQRDPVLFVRMEIEAEVNARVAVHAQRLLAANRHAKPSEPPMPPTYGTHEAAWCAAEDAIANGGWYVAASTINGMSATMLRMSPWGPRVY